MHICTTHMAQFLGTSTLSILFQQSVLINFVWPVLTPKFSHQSLLVQHRSGAFQFTLSVRKNMLIQRIVCLLMKNDALVHLTSLRSPIIEPKQVFILFLACVMFLTS